MLVWSGINGHGGCGACVRWRKGGREVEKEREEGAQSKTVELEMG